MVSDELAYELRFRPIIIKTTARIEIPAIEIVAISNRLPSGGRVDDVVSVVVVDVSVLVVVLVVVVVPEPIVTVKEKN